MEEKDKVIGELRSKVKKEEDMVRELGVQVEEYRRKMEEMEGVLESAKMRDKDEEREREIMLR